MELKTINGFYNEKGNVSSKARNSLKEQALAKVLHILQSDDLLGGAVRNADGGISIPLCVNEQGETVYARFEMTISVKDPTVKTEHKKSAPKSKATPTDDIVLFQLNWVALCHPLALPTLSHRVR